MDSYNNLNDGDLNPKVQIELEKLNTTSAQINEFENKLQDLRNAFNETLSKCSSQLSEMSNKLGSSVNRARSYYECKWSNIEILRESQIAASRYETACAELSHAIAVVNKSESSAKETSKLDDSAMEILNIAIAKVNFSKKEKIEANREHQKYLTKYTDLEKKIHLLERRYSNDIKKASDYFIYTKCMDDKLKEDKLNIEAYEEKIRICKSLYNQSLQRLEEISNKIHEDRKQKELLGPRGEGVGAEMDKPDLVEHGYEAQDLSPVAGSRCVDSTEPSVSSTHSTGDSLSRSHRVSDPGARRPRLSSSTPIVDSLRRAMLANHSLSLSDSKRPFYPVLPRDCPSLTTSALKRVSATDSISSNSSCVAIDDNSDNL